MSSRTFRVLGHDEELGLTQAALILNRAYPTLASSGTYGTDDLLTRFRARMKNRYEFHAVYEEGRASSSNFGRVLVAARTKSKEEKEKPAVENAVPASTEGTIYPLVVPPLNEAVMVGIWAHLKFEGLYYGIGTPVAGLSFVATDFFNKKRGLAHDIVKQFLLDARDRSQPLTALWAFRPDFYASVGFGNCAINTEHTFSPMAFPKAPSAVSQRYPVQVLPIGLPEAGEQTCLNALRDCYQSFSKDHHGLFVRNDIDFKTQAGLSDPSLQYVGFVDTEAESDSSSSLRLGSYIIFKIVGVRSPEGNFSFTQDLKVIEYAYLNPDALLAICSFLRGQADQVRNVILPSLTGPEEILQLLADQDNRDQIGVVERRGAEVGELGHHGGVVGFGFMIRVVDFPKLMECWAERHYDIYGMARKFPEKVSWRVAVTCKDQMLPDNDGRMVIEFGNDGKGKVLCWKGDAEYDVDVSFTMAVRDLSSMLVGAITIKQLHRVGLMKVEPASAVDAVSKLFASDEKPACLTNF
ncbi:sterol carrier protein domain-containing protein [Cladochytrium replicatum]|nr:sterol carrier protein domain-containing protein [Cladochytrium replicatum]